MNPVDESNFAHAYADLCGLRMHYVEAGEGPAVIMLHGFPEAWFSYRHQLLALSRGGYRAVAPDQRGYNLTEKPRGVRQYTLDHLTGDVARLIHALGERTATIVGHDWGGVVAWSFAMRYPDLLDRLVILNAPHPERTVRLGLRMPRQWLRSSYVAFFQLPRLPELLLSANDFSALRTVFRRQPVNPGAFAGEEVNRYVEAIRRPGALTAALNYYRALGMRAPFGLTRHLRRIDAPVLVIWGERDPYLDAALAAPNRHWVPDYRLERIRDSSHWVQNDCPERVNELLLAFMRG